MRRRKLSFKATGKTLFSIIYCVIVFFVALTVLEAVMNRGNTDRTIEMGDATLPVLNYRYGSYDLASLHGYVSAMDVASIRDNLTPLREDRTLNFDIYTCDNVIGSVRYELRTMDGTRLIENGDVTNYLTEGSVIHGSFTLKDLMQPGEEYSLCLILQTPQQEAIYYYTRLFKEEDMDPYSMLSFAFNFSHKTFDKANAEKDIKMYLEPNSQGDNSTFHKVDIHSSFSQITWGDLKISRVTSPKASILDIDRETASLRIDYMALMREEEKEIYFRVKEYFRIRKGEERMYLLDYERTMDQIFDHRTGTIANNKFVLGITDENVEMAVSPDGGRVAFASGGRLYSYNVTDNKLADIFTYYTQDMLDARTTYWKNNIRIFSVDETGNVEFMVYGYASRGVHEGEVGISFYYYDSVLNSIEEQLYIPYHRSYEVLGHNLDILSFMNNASRCYLFLEGFIYEFNVKDNKFKVLEEGLKEDNFVYSADHQMIAWVDDMDHADTISMYDLQSTRKVIISSATGEKLRPIGFFGHDLIYGIARERDIAKNLHGTTLFPMYRIIICNESNKILKQYEEPGFYTVETKVQPGKVTLERIRKMDDGSWEEAIEDHILNNTPEETGRNRVETVITDTYEKIVQVAVKNEINTQQMQVLTPMFVLHEGGSEASLDLEDTRTEDYYVYFGDELLAVTRQTSRAATLAYEENGTVMNSRGKVVYDKTVLPVKNRIMAVGGSGSREEDGLEGVKAECINALLAYNGIIDDVTGLVKAGKLPEEILREKLPEAEIVELRGCKLDVALSYVANNIPVLVEFTDGSAFLIVGYDKYNTIVMDPGRGEVYYIGMNDSTELYEQNGNRFIAYIP